MTPNAARPQPLRPLDEAMLDLNEFIVRDLGAENAIGIDAGQLVEIPIPADRAGWLRDVRAARASLRRNRVLTHRVPRFRARSGLRGGRPGGRSRRSGSRASPPSDSDPHEPEPARVVGGGR